MSTEYVRTETHPARVITVEPGAQVGIAFGDHGDGAVVYADNPSDLLAWLDSARAAILAEHTHLTQASPAPALDADHMHVALDALNYLNAGCSTRKVTPWADYAAAVDPEDDPKAAPSTYRQVLEETRTRLEGLLSIA